MKQLVQLQERYEDFKQLDAEVIAIFREETDGVAGLQKSIEKTNAKFPMVVDENSEKTGGLQPQRFRHLYCGHQRPGAGHPRWHQDPTTSRRENSGGASTSFRQRGQPVSCGNWVTNLYPQPSAPPQPSAQLPKASLNMNTRSALALALLGVTNLVPLTASAKSPYQYPVTRRVDHVDEYHGTEVADPYRWLEEDVRESAAVAEWVREENK